MATKSVTALLDAERFAELKQYAETKEVDGKKLTLEQAASLVMNTGLSRLMSLANYAKKGGAAKKPRAPKAAKAPKAPKAKAASKTAAPKAKAKGKADAPKAKAAAKSAAPAKKPAAVKVERKRPIAAAAKKPAAVNRMAPQRPTPVAPVTSNGVSSAPVAEVAQA